MKLFLSLVLFGFCQLAWAAVTVSGSNKFGEIANCSLEDAIVTKKAGSNTLTYQFSHSGKFTLNPLANSGLAEICKVQLSSNTKTSDLIGGWKFQAATVNDITFVFSSSTCPNRLSTVNMASMDLGASTQSSKKTFIVTSINSQATTCPFTLIYSIVLVPDSNSSQGNNPLLPLIHVGLQDDRDSPGAILVVSRDNNLSSVSPDPSPRSTCSLSVPSNLNLGNISPSVLTGVNAKSSAKEFSVAFNCSQINSFSFTPKVQMSFGLASGTSCLAPNSVADSSAAASGVNLEISRKDNGTTVCPTTSAAPTTLQFKTNTNTNIVYSDNITLRAAFVNTNATGAVPKTGVFTSTVVFTITSF